MSVRMLLGVALVGLLLGGPADAAPLSVDELGNFSGGILGSIKSNDPGPGGRTAALTYTLPFVGMKGDVQLLEPSGATSDFIRFNGNGTLIFYSDIDESDTNDSPSFPFANYPNPVTRTELGAEGNNSVTYTPINGQPGFDPSTPTYTFVSDGMVPEPASLVMSSTAALIGLGYVWYRRKRATA
jgi:hypothetical protein